jgi:hypothetical protein
MYYNMAIGGWDEHQALVTLKMTPKDARQAS